jgi:hypothetical protein
VVAGAEGCAAAAAAVPATEAAKEAGRQAAVPGLAVWREAAEGTPLAVLGPSAGTVAVRLEADQEAVAQGAEGSVRAAMAEVEMATQVAAAVAVAAV